MADCISYSSSLEINLDLAMVPTYGAKAVEVDRCWSIVSPRIAARHGITGRVEP